MIIVACLILNRFVWIYSEFSHQAHIPLAAYIWEAALHALVVEIPLVTGDSSQLIYRNAHTVSESGINKQHFSLCLDIESFVPETTSKCLLRAQIRTTFPTF